MTWLEHWLSVGTDKVFDLDTKNALQMSKELWYFIGIEEKHNCMIQFGSVVNNIYIVITAKSVLTCWFLDSTYK